MLSFFRLCRPRDRGAKSYPQLKPPLPHEGADGVDDPPEEENVESKRVTFSDSHLGQVTTSLCRMVSSSNFVSQSLHLYSYRGISILHFINCLT